MRVMNTPDKERFYSRHDYRPQTKLREGYVFTGVCDSVNRQEVYPIMPFTTTI